MKFAVAALLGATSAYSLNSEDAISETEYKFMSYVSSFNRSYGTVAEYKFRLAQF